MSGLREEYRTAIWRGVLAACITGALGFFGQWTQAAGMRDLVASGVVPFLTTMLSFVLYGTYDARQNDARKGAQPQPEPQPSG